MSLSQLVFQHPLQSRSQQLIVLPSTQNGNGDWLFNLSWGILQIFCSD
jgi:hypothetical protein